MEFRCKRCATASSLGPVREAYSGLQRLFQWWLLRIPVFIHEGFGIPVIKCFINGSVSSIYPKRNRDQLNEVYLHSLQHENPPVRKAYIKRAIKPWQIICSHNIASLLKLDFLTDVGIHSVNNMCNFRSLLFGVNILIYNKLKLYIDYPLDSFTIVKFYAWTQLFCDKEVRQYTCLVLLYHTSDVFL